MILYATTFMCGAALMAIELLATRVLAPVMGSSIFVWGAVISSVMISLSLGYWLGGILADRAGAERSLPPVIGAAGLLTVLSPLVSQVVLKPSAALGPRLGPLVAATVIFAGPCLFLATVAPLAVRIAASRGLDRIGRSAGGLYAVSTAGSILGTIATAFWLIPLMQVGPLIVGIGALLSAVSIGSIALLRGAREEQRQRVGRAWLTAVLALAVAGAGAGLVVYVRVSAPERVNDFGEKVLLRQETQYHRVSVTEKDGTRSLRFDNTRQTAVDVATGYESRIRYPDYFHLALALQPKATRVLVLGMGGGTATKRFWRDYRDISVDSVEIDPVVVDIAERYFALPHDPRLRYSTDDARRYVASTRERYDVVMVDAYYADALPFHLTTREFFTQIDRCLKPGGVVAYNVISAIDGDRSRLFRGIYRTAGATWDHLRVFPIGLADGGDPAARRNIILLATNADVPRETLLARVRSRVDGRVTIRGFADFGRDLYEGIVPVADVPLLTDAHAPVDELISVD